MEKEFILPDKWCIEVTEDNWEVIDKWKQTTKFTDCAKHYKFINYEGSGDWRCGSKLITFDQFKQYVLKEPVKKDFVNITTQKEWDFVCKILNYNFSSIPKITKKICLRLSDCAYNEEKAFNDNKYYTFQEWCDLNGYKMEEEIPGYVEYNNKIYKVIEWTPHNYCILKEHSDCKHPVETLEPFKHLIKSSTKEAYEAQFKPKQSLDNCKIWIGDNPELNKLVQEKLFGLGYEWISSGKEVQEYRNIWIYNHHDKMLCLGNSKNCEYEILLRCKEITPEDLGIVTDERHIEGIDQTSKCDMSKHWNNKPLILSECNKKQLSRLIDIEEDVIFVAPKIKITNKLLIKD